MNKTLYESQVEETLYEVERILRKEAPKSRGVEIVVKLEMDAVPTVTYTIKDKVVL